MPRSTPSDSKTQTPSTPASSDFVADVRAIRERARRHIEEGAVTEDYAGKTEVVTRVLNEALATELVCTLRYRRHYFMGEPPRRKRRGFNGSGGRAPPAQAPGPFRRASGCIA
jgi:hypothetical protein